MSHLSSLIIQFVEHSGYLAVFFLMFLESALLPIPSEITMPFAGFLAQGGHLNLLIIIIIGALGNLGGSLIAYALGFYLEENLILNLIKKYGKYLFLKIADYEKGLFWLKKYGESVAFFSRLLPIIRTFVSLPAGLSEINIWKFSIFTFLGSFIWSGILTLIGYYLGKNWEIIQPFFQKSQILIIGLLIIGIVYYFYKKFKKIK